MVDESSSHAKIIKTEVSVDTNDITISNFLRRTAGSSYMLSDYIPETDSELIDRLLMEAIEGDFYPCEYHNNPRNQLANLNAKKGDIIRVTRKPTHTERVSWDNTWVDQMDGFVGKDYPVIRLSHDSIHLMDSLLGSYAFPPWVLRKVKHGCELKK